MQTINKLHIFYPKFLPRFWLWDAANIIYCGQKFETVKGIENIRIHNFGKRFIAVIKIILHIRDIIIEGKLKVVFIWINVFVFIKIFFSFLIEEIQDKRFAQHWHIDNQTEVKQEWLKRSKIFLFWVLKISNIKAFEG